MKTNLENLGKFVFHTNGKVLRLENINDQEKSERVSLRKAIEVWIPDKLR